MLGTILRGERALEATFSIIETFAKVRELKRELLELHKNGQGLLGQAFAAQGFRARRTKHSRGYIVVQRPANEIKERLTMLALDDSAF